LIRGSKRGKNSAAYAEIGVPHVGALFRAFEAQRDAAKVMDGHRHGAIRSAG
jgi:hypothetical protein